MSRVACWKNTSYEIAGGGWVPKATVYVFEGGEVAEQEILSPDVDIERIKQGTLRYSDEEAETAAYTLVKKVLWDKWGIPEQRIKKMS